MSKNLDEIQQNIAEFRDKRGWRKYHNPLDLTVAMNIEVSEALELLMFKSREEISEFLKNPKNKRDFSHELADVFVYLIAICNSCDIKLEKAVNEKMEINEKRYPPGLVRGKKLKYNEYER